jgi:hypothetical protein
MSTAAANALIEHEPVERHPVLPSPAAITPMTMIDRALATNATPETLERLLALQERWEANQARKAFDEAMAGAKAEIPVILKNRVVDFTGKTGIRTHYRHEDLGEIARTVDPVLAKHGLSYRFRTQSPIGEPVTVTCIVSHRDGHSEENTLVGPRDDSGNKNPIQSVGSTITFLQRYTLKAALGLAAAEDDDGQKSDAKVEDGPISDEQVKAIRTLADEVGADLERFCTYFKIEAVPDLPRSQFERAVASLEKKRKK